ncbi:MAG: hypothetical protein V3S22_04835, partial [Candidatus Neomarinimicrobiota bacterium]
AIIPAKIGRRNYWAEGSNSKSKLEKIEEEVPATVATLLCSQRDRQKSVGRSQKEKIFDFFGDG